MCSQDVQCNYISLWLLYSPGGEDYDQESVGLIFNEDNTRRCVNITIIDDNVYEDPENFIVEITNVGPDPDVELDPDTAEILILDNNGNQH